MSDADLVDYNNNDYDLDIQTNTENIFGDNMDSKSSKYYSNGITILVFVFTFINILLPFYYKRITSINSCTIVLFGLLFVLSGISVMLTPLIADSYMSKKSIIKYQEVSISMAIFITVFNCLCIYLLNISNGDGSNINSSNNTNYSNTY